MKINEVLESINKAIDTMRSNRGIETKGHFVAIPTIKNEIGPYKRCTITIDYVNLDEHENFRFCYMSNADKCRTGEEDALIKKCALLLLTAFFVKWEKYKEAILIGDYGCE